ncbi:hypothetical protein ABZ770_16535 [Streptomyces sp. NPDC006654]|uniref:hypothetical protein n=1 Tax=Streptomyces sp. NPDC006654 TaxID=3156897 RepID=UPI003408DB1E
MTDGGSFQGNPSQLRSVIDHLEEIRQRASELVSTFKFSAQQYDAYPGHGDSYADQLRPQWKGNVQGVEDAGTAFAQAITGVVGAQLIMLRGLQEPQQQALDDIHSTLDHDLNNTNIPGSDGGRR